MLGFVLGIIVLFFLFIGIVSIAVSSLGKEKVSIADNSVLHLTLDQPVAERTSANPFDKFDFNSFSSTKQPGLNDILAEIDKASRDPKIKGIYLDVSTIQAGFAATEEIRNALLNFRKSGKFVYAFADAYSQGAYYLASASDKVYVNPQGMIELHGLAVQMMFYKGLFEKLEIEPQVIRHGKYKSAVEPYILDKMSDANRAQIAGFVDPIWEHVVQQIAASRELSTGAVKLAADSLLIREAKDAVGLKLVDKAVYYDEFVADINARLGNKPSDKPEMVSLNAYRKVRDTKKTNYSADKIAVIYAVGAIESGNGDDNTIGSDRLAEAIREARLDKKVKAIVLRVNSPGGSALASDVIWREATLAKQEKPFIVSMGSVAASGGYYISCAADTIVAQPNTITGSIGVFGLLFNAQNMLNHKLGITVDTYKTGPYTDLGTPTRPMSEAEKAMIQQEIEHVYDTFTSRVAKGRHMKQADVDSIGQGRVWSGIDAKRIGLVDVIGGLNDAIAIAAKKAKMTDYRIKELPEQKDPMDELLKSFSEGAETWYMEQKIGSDYKYVKATEEVMKHQGIQALTPYNPTF